TVGRIPLRKKRERAYRPGWDPEHQWQGFVPFDGLPSLANPARGFVATANNRVAPDDFPYPLAGCWATGYRHRRARERLQAQAKWSREECQHLQLDTYSGRAADCVPALVRQLRDDAEPRVRQAAALLADWDCRIDVDSVPATLFNVFFQQWCKAVARERLPAAQPVCGDGTTLCAGIPDAGHQSYLGAGYRMVADLSDPQCGLWSIELAGASGQAHSPHHADQIEPWNAGRLFYLPLRGSIEGEVLTL